LKVSGFTFVRNAVKFDYPVIESIRSILPLCDELVVAVGKSDDTTRDEVGSVDSGKIRIIDTVWDDTLHEGGRVLAQETDKAFDNIDPSSDWAFYIQADEVIHEKYHEIIRKAMNDFLEDRHVEGLLFNFLHFYGSYDFTGDSLSWYRKEVRIIRNDHTIRSYRDAQGFRKNEKPLYVTPIDAFVYHYGWVKPPALLQAKLESFHKLWHDEQWIEQNLPKSEVFDYSSIDSLAKFVGTHPALMQDRIARKNWQFTFDPTLKKTSLKNRILAFFEKLTGWRIGEYRNYRIIR